MAEIDFLPIFLEFCKQRYPIFLPIFCRFFWQTGTTLSDFFADFLPIFLRIRKTHMQIPEPRSAGFINFRWWLLDRGCRKCSKIEDLDIIETESNARIEKTRCYRNRIERSNRKNSMLSNAESNARIEKTRYYRTNRTEPNRNRNRNSESKSNRIEPKSNGIEPKSKRNEQNRIEIEHYTVNTFNLSCNTTSQLYNGCRL